MTNAPLPSPCISICQIDPISGNCLGCYRTREEIARWSRMSHDEQQSLISSLQDRRAQVTGRSRRKPRRIAS